MAEDVTKGIHRSCSHCTFTTPDKRAFLQHQLDAHESSVVTFNSDRRYLPSVYDTPVENHRSLPHRPALNQTLLPADTETPPRRVSSELEEEIDLSPVYEHPGSHNGPPVVRTYHCSQCFKSTDSPRLHLHHLVKDHGLDLTIYECDLCDYATKYKQKLIHHLSCHVKQAVAGGHRKPVSQYDMLGSSTNDDSYGQKSSKLQDNVDGIGNNKPMNASPGSFRIKDINENVKRHPRKSTETDLTCTEKMEPLKHAVFATDEQDLLCNESVANDSAEFESKPSKDNALHDEDDGSNLVIDLGENQNQNNNKVDPTPAILKAVSLATANSMVGRPTMVPVTLSVKRDLDIRPTPPTPTATATGTKLTKKGTVPVREAVDPAKYVRLQDVDGVRYACSKCGNVYKWRKSLNKHWKEKHDGEIPVPASGSFTNILNIPHIKGGTPNYSTPKSSATSTRALVTPSMLNSSGAISSYALDKYIVDMGAQSGGRSIQSFNSTTPSSAAAAAVLATRNMLNKPGSFNSMLHTNIPFPSAQAQQHLSFGSMRFMKPETTATTSVLPKFPNFSTVTQDKMRLPTTLPPAAHGRNLLKHEVMDEDSYDDMPLDLSKKSKPATNVLDLTSPATSVTSSRPGSAMMGGDQPLDFSIKSNPGSERSTPVHTSTGRSNVDREDLEQQPWLRATSTPESDVYNNLQCYKCPFVANDKGSFEEHLEQHTNHSQYPQCAQCKQHFSSNDELTQHFGLHHLHTLNQVNLADDEGHPEGSHNAASAPAAGQLYQYLTKQQEAKEQRCVVCDAKFPWQRDLSRHFTHLHPDLPNPYSKKRSLEADGDEAEPWHKVSKFDQYSSMEGRQGASEGELECEQCTFVARDGAEMARHQLVHSFNRPHACTMCGFSSKSRDELQAHMWKYHPNHAEELAMMASSGGVTPVSMSKSRHTPVNTNDGSPTHNAADTSGSSANSGGEFGYDDVIIVTPNTTEVPLVRGRKSGGKGGPSSSAEILLPYKCSVCEYRARWPSEITQHMKNHSDEKPYHCPRCTYKSKWKWDVVKHLKRCGGGTVKDVIDTSSRHLRKPDQDDLASLSSNQSVVKQLQFRSSSPKHASLSNGPPNVTVLPPNSPHTVSLLESAHGSSSPTSTSSDIIPYSRSTSSPANSVSSEPASASSRGDDLQSGKARTQVFQSLSSQGLYHCLKCPFIANSPAELKRHCRVHSDDKPFSCQTCGYSSKWKCDLKKHVRTYNHKAAPRAHGHDNKGGDVNHKLTSGEDENMSSSDEMSVGEPSCSLSQDESPAAPKPTLYKCDKCQYVTYKKNFLDGHMKIHRQAHEKSGKLKCKQCDFEASDLPSFLQHKLTHSTQQAADASPIGDSGVINLDTKGERETSPQRHRRKPLKYLSCNKCPYSCLQQAKLDIHESMHEPRGRDSLSCKFCDYNVYNQALLIQHMKLHPEYEDWHRIHGYSPDDEGQDEMECLEMDEAEHTESLYGGLSSEEATKPLTRNGFGGMKLMVSNPTESGLGFSCSKCKFSTENRAYFEDHIRHHGSEQKYQCEHCDWSVDKLNYLYRHVREVHPQHLTMREYDGNTVTMGEATGNEDKPENLSRSDSRLSHKKAPRKSQICSDCGYVTDNNSKMSSHRLKHESEKDKKCHYCSYVLTNTAEMRKHLLSIHGVDVGNEDGSHHVITEQISTRRNSMSPMGNEAYSSDEPSTGQLIDIKGQQMYLVPNGNRKLFACPKCSYRTNNSSHCVSHVQQHGSGKKYTCEYCDYSLEKLSQIFHHMKMCHPTEMDTTDTEPEAFAKGNGKIATDKKLVCFHCPYRGKTVESLQRHMEMHEYDGRYTCEQCDFSVDKENLLQEHLPVHHSTTNKIKTTKMFSLPNSRSMRTKLVYKPVLQKAARPTPASKGRMKIRYRCAKCPYSTESKSLIIKHRRSHLVSSKYKCQHCDYSATRYSLLKQHLSFHTNSPLSDTASDKSMYKDIYLENQLNRHRLLNVNKEECRENLHKLRSSKGCVMPKLRIVLKPVTNKFSGALRKNGAKTFKRSYNCRHCPFASDKRLSYESHVRMHGGDAQYRCTYCNYAATNTYLLQQHVRLHEQPQGNSTGNRFSKKRFRCAKCPYHTLSKFLLDLHFQMHSGLQTNPKESECERAKSYYKCERCPYMTYNKNNFESHKGQHAVRSKLRCPYCDFSSQLTAQIGSHIKLHFPGSPLEGAALRDLILAANPSIHIGPDSPMTLEGNDSGLGSHKRPLEPTNNNNTDIKRGSICQYCEQDFANEAERQHHEQQHLIGAS